MAVNASKYFIDFTSLDNYQAPILLIKEKKILIYTKSRVIVQRTGRRSKENGWNELADTLEDTSKGIQKLSHKIMKLLGKVEVKDPDIIKMEKYWKVK